MPSHGRADGLIHHGAQAALVDVAHREGAHAGIAHVRLLHLIHVAQADDHRIRGVHLRREAEHVGQFRADRCRRKHASGMPWTLPLGLLSGVFISACASIQIRPTFSPRMRKKRETPPTVPTAME